MVTGMEGQRCGYLRGRRSWRGMRRLSGGVNGARRGEAAGKGVMARVGEVTVGLGVAGPGGRGEVEEGWMGDPQLGGGLEDPQFGG